jgi:hypothetical protein
MDRNPTRIDESAHGWRSMQVSDLAHVCGIAAAVHPNLPERPEVFAEKLRLNTPGCFVLEHAREIVGYAICHPWRLYEIPPLDAYLVSLPSRPDCLYVHDVAISREARGRRSLAALMKVMIGRCRADGLSALALVSVHGTADMWGKFGFREAPDARLGAKLQSYGPDARYMIAALA